MPRKSETKVVNNIISALEREFGGVWYKTHGSMFGKRGKQDIIGCCPFDIHEVGGPLYGKIGLYVAIEVKQGKNKPSKLQYYRIKKDQEAGAISFWTNSVTDAISQLKQHLDHIKN